MKEFEKWWKDNRFGKNHTPNYRETWKAALEKVLERMDFEKQMCDFDRHPCFTLREWVEQELNDERI